MTNPRPTLAALYENIEKSRGEFLVSRDGVLSYADLAEYLKQCCARFDQSGLAAGSRILIVSRDEASVIVLFVAALLDGKVPIILAPDVSEARAAAIRRAVSPGMIVVDQSRSGEGWTSGATFMRSPDHGILGRVLKARCRFNLETPRAGRAPLRPDLPDALAYILFTSGTTQAPIGVTISQRNLLSQVATLSRLFGYNVDSRIFNALTLSHADGLVQGPVLAIANGCAVIRTEAFSVPAMERWLDSVRAHGVTHFLTVPTVYSLIDRYAAHDDYFNGRECRYLFSVAAKLDASLWRRLEARFSRKIWNQYGLTETVTSGLYAGDHPDMGPVGTIGKPIDMQARVRRPGSDGGAAVQEGELQLRGENVSAGYWNDPRRTAEAFTADGWLRTGDWVRQTSDGAYEILGRIKTAIMCGGLMIRPEEIDEVLLAHPKIKDAATLGIPDEIFGEVPVSSIVLEEHLNEAAITAYCRANLELLKVPKRIYVVPAIPRGNSGKPLFPELRLLQSSDALIESSEPDTQQAGVSDHQIFDVAARVFRVKPETLNRFSSPSDVPGWDSFSQINLVLTAEREFSVRVATSKVAAIRNLGDLVRAINDGR